MPQLSREMILILLMIVAGGAVTWYAVDYIRFMMNQMTMMKLIIKEIVADLDDPLLGLSFDVKKRIQRIEEEYGRKF